MHSYLTRRHKSYLPFYTAYPQSTPVHSLLQRTVKHRNDVDRMLCIFLELFFLVNLLSCLVLASLAFQSIYPPYTRSYFLKITSEFALDV